MPRVTGNSISTRVPLSRRVLIAGIPDDINNKAIRNAARKLCRKSRVVIESLNNVGYDKSQHRD